MLSVASPGSTFAVQLVSEYPFQTSIAPGTVPGTLRVSGGPAAEKADGRHVACHIVTYKQHRSVIQQIERFHPRCDLFCHPLRYGKWSLERIQSLPASRSGECCQG